MDDLEGNASIPPKPHRWSPQATTLQRMPCQCCTVIPQDPWYTMVPPSAGPHSQSASVC
ncbi:hypothetical protein BC826DRAFT_1081812 [Russula brevipes]|nr:hypothetical protein BC826DRAFT_1081812 [Russula brevipes]